jgi:hypothetical protein
MVTAIAEIKPRDGVERMLAVQMAATHVAMMRAGRWIVNADNLAQVQAPSLFNGGYHMKGGINPMQSAHAALRCTANSERSGLLCKNPVVRGWAACRTHGAGGGANCGVMHPNYRHGIRNH